MLDFGDTIIHHGTYLEVIAKKVFLSDLNVQHMMEEVGTFSDEPLPMLTNLINCKKRGCSAGISKWCMSSLVVGPIVLCYGILYEDYTPPATSQLAGQLSMLEELQIPVMISENRQELLDYFKERQKKNEIYYGLKKKHKIILNAYVNQISLKEIGKMVEDSPQNVGIILKKIFSSIGKEKIIDIYPELLNNNIFERVTSFEEYKEKEKEKKEKFSNFI